jgi:hypothetical protein
MNLTERYKILQQKQLYSSIDKIQEIVAKAVKSKTKPSKEEAEMIQSATIMLYGVSFPKEYADTLNAMIE